MKVTIENNKHINHWINHDSIFAFCFGFGLYIRVGLSIIKSEIKQGYFVEIQLLYWRIWLA